MTTCCLLSLPLLVNAPPPRPGGLYSGYYAIQAAQRYERYWTAVLKTRPVGKGGAAILPPLDVAYAWCVRESIHGNCPVHKSLAGSWRY